MNSLRYLLQSFNYHNEHKLCVYMFYFGHWFYTWKWSFGVEVYESVINSESDGVQSMWKSISWNHSYSNLSLSSTQKKVQFFSGGERRQSGKMGKLFLQLLWPAKSLLSIVFRGLFSSFPTLKYRHLETELCVINDSMMFSPSDKQHTLDMVLLNTIWFSTLTLHSIS